MRKARLALASLSAAVVGLLAPGTVANAATTEPIPNSMDALGDSITRGFNACGWYVDCTSRSWSAGDYSTVNSHYLRILAKNAAIQGKNFNDAKSGAKAVDVAGQASSAVSRGVDYVTVLIGANDACTSSESTMTSVTTFRSQIDSALDTISSGLPNARIFVGSVPDVYRLWYIGHTSSAAVTAWNSYKICQSELANPTSTAKADEDRRQRVRQRVIDFNTQLQQSCAARAHCVFDGNAIFSYPFVLSQVSQWDYFHPNTSGQAVLADVTYKAGFGW